MTNRRDSAECPVPGCPRRHSRRHLMCALHWRNVPRQLRDNVWTTYKQGGPFSDEYQDAAQAAIESVSA